MPPARRVLPGAALCWRQLSQIDAHFIKSPQPHVLNQILGSLTSSGASLAALRLSNRMLLHPTAHNHYTFTYAVKACSFLRDRHMGTAVHARAIKSGHSHDVFIHNSLIHFYFLFNDVAAACRVFDQIESPDVVSWTSIVSGISKCGFEKEAIGKFIAMDVEPNGASLVSVLSACCGLRLLNNGKAIHCYVLRNWSEASIILWNAILDLYVKCGLFSSAQTLFGKMPLRDVFSWTTMIGGYAIMGDHEEAVELFLKMLKVGPKPNEATIVNVLSACSSYGALASGGRVYACLNSRLDFPVTIAVGNALINMFVKCGSVDRAIDLFNKLESRDIISWSTIISGLAMNGYGNRALQFFTLMLVQGVSPDDVTFIALLSACSYSGLIKQGLMLFEAMHRIYGVEVQMQHYTCVVDMYGRAGLLEEAEAFIKAMPVEGDGSVWGALLHACKVYGNEVMFERIMKGIQGSGSRSLSIGTLALLSNTYAGSEKWDDSNRVRDAMRLEGLKKMAGYSWVEVTPRNQWDDDEWEPISASLGLDFKAGMKELLEILSSASEYDQLVIRPGEQEMVQELILHQRYYIENTDWKDPHRKANALLQAYFSRQHVGGDLALDQKEVVGTATRLVHALIDLAVTNEWVHPVLEAVELCQSISQGMWQSDPSLMQLPYFTWELAERCRLHPENPIRSMADLMGVEEEERRKLLEMTDSQMQDISRFCKRFPKLWVQPPEDLIMARAGDAVRLEVTLDRDMQGLLEVEYVDAPRYPKRKIEFWFVVLVDTMTDQLLAV